MHARTRGRLAAAATTTALIVTGGFAQPLLTAGAAHAAPLPVWNAPVTVGSDEFAARAMEVAALPDGSAVALWRDRADVFAAVRPADSDLWGMPKQLGSGATDRIAPRLVTGADGVATAVWAEGAAQQPGGPVPATRLMTAAFRAAGSWSAPHELLGMGAAAFVADVQVAPGPQGTATAVWSSRPVGGQDPASTATSAVYAAARAADGVWSTPVPVAAATADGESVGAADAAVDTAGTAVIAYRHTAPGDRAQIKTVTREGLGGAWGAPVPLSALQVGTREPNIGAGPEGSLVVTWPEQAGEDVDDQDVLVSVRRPGAAAWGPVQQVPVWADDTTVPAPEPLIAPDGDVTLVWWEWQDRGDDTAEDLYSATLPADGSTWSRQKISTARASTGHDVSIGPDGTVRVLWTTTRSQDSARWEQLTTATRTPDDGAWSAPVPVPHDGPQAPAWRGGGQIAAGPARSATVLWNASNGEGVKSSRTAFRPPVGTVSARVPATAALAGTTPSSVVWAPEWKLNQQVESWKLTLTEPSGRVFRTFSGYATGTIAPKWNGRDTSTPKALAPNGPLTWRLTARGPQAASDTVLASGRTVTVTGGAAVRRDAGGRAGTPDGTGDLLSTTASGSLRIAYGNPATGNFSGSSTTTGWPKGFRPVPVGNMSGDRCNDTLVRLADGVMRRYTPACGAALKPSSPYKVLGRGWNAYDLITSPGDLTGDGRPELIARDPKTGTLYRYDTVAATGLFAPRVSLGAGFKGYKKIVGAGDLNGDGRGDLLLQDASNELWRMNGNKSGKLDARVLVAAGWGASYDAVVGAGDLTGDGRADLVARDTSGRIWRFNGTGKGTFGAGTQLGTGWQVYQGVH
ncbi:FG-GAP repeat domain-containing protein [Streptomyces sp. NBC_00239]|uniref:FG-GAP repeat domain-containing protein n=1 Tax=Streptomyces sp. NBC_00239 TaxID=2903640 RepID=UPI002E2CEE17|nr:VCBS repeat-containing protein [Streptomyces sp. NBC_00239]